jgi:EPS-associated MarR family transcriptional regulator
MTDKAFSDDDAHWQVLRLLEINPEISQRELAVALGVSLGKTNYCLKALLDKGLLKIQNFQSSKRKLAYAYVLTPAGIREKAALTRRFLARKVGEYERLRVEIEALQTEVGAAKPLHTNAP